MGAAKELRGQPSEDCGVVCGSPRVVITENYDLGVGAMETKTGPPNEDLKYTKRQTIACVVLLFTWIPGSIAILWHRITLPPWPPMTSAEWFARENEINSTAIWPPILFFAVVLITIGCYFWGFSKSATLPTEEK